MKKEELQNKLAEKTILQYKDKDTLTTSKQNLIEVFTSAQTWVVDTDEEKMNDIENSIWKTRGCFQTTCSEWDNSTMDEKITKLKNLSNNNLDVFQLSIRMKMMGVEDFNKEIDDLDLVIGMSKIIDYLLKEKDNDTKH